MHKKDLLYSTGNYTQYLVITYNAKEPEKEYIYGASLVAQWLRIRLPMQGTHTGEALVREDPTCCGATKPVWHNF